MTDLLATRPTPRSRVWSGSKVIAEDIEGDDLVDVLQLHTDAAAWWVLPRSDAEAGRELRRAANALDLDELAIHDLLADDHRAKFEELGQARLVLTNAVSVDVDRTELSASPVSLVVTDRALICLVDVAEDGFHPERMLASRADQLSEGGVEHALQLVLGAVVASYADAVQWLESRSDEVADALFQERPLKRAEQVQVYRLRTCLTQLRRLTEPMRGVTDELASGQARDAATARRWTLIAQQHRRVADGADALRESLASSFDTSLALADLRSNAVMKQLSGWAAIIAVPTLISGYAGMNVNFPLTGTEAGFWVYTVVMVVAALLLFITFRRNHWI